jgi:isoamylase
LADLVSYNEKHNEANGEGNRDGESFNRSWNSGVEGPTDDAAVKALRRQQQCNFLATLFLSQGVPMLLHGDEMGRSQQGNNNAYCQDNEISWLDWDLREENKDLLELTGHLSALRRDHPVFRRRRWFFGRPIRGSGVSDIGWFAPDGTEMSDEDWQAGVARSIGVLLNGEAIPDPDPRGERVTDDSFLLLFNADSETQRFRIPVGDWGEHWVTVLDTDHLEPLGSSWHPGLGEGEPVKAGDDLEVAARSILLLRRVH